MFRGLQNIDIVREVLRHYPDLELQEIHFLGNHGGFSGAHLWRLQGAKGPFCLRAWPLAMQPARLQWIHALMERACQAGLHFVPRVMRTRNEETFLLLRKQCWEILTWLPGEANFSHQPSVPRMEAACLALAQLHQVWAAETTRGSCPAIQRRLLAARAWLALQHQGWQPAPLPEDPIGSIALRAWPLVCDRVPQVPAQLLPWTAIPFSLQPCLCDPWHDHILFQENAVTGLIDYGSVKTDHVCVDLARLLGSLAGSQPQLWHAGLEGYRKARSLAFQEIQLLDILDETGTLLAAANWLRWLYHEQRPYPDRQAVAQRLATLVKRLEEKKVGQDADPDLVSELLNR
jgi:Ser/Thr protein kinase RdoA (MazF antagonist)